MITNQTTGKSRHPALHTMSKEMPFHFLSQTKDSMWKQECKKPLQRGQARVRPVNSDSTKVGTFYSEPHVGLTLSSETILFLWELMLWTQWQRDGNNGGTESVTFSIYCYQSHCESIINWQNPFWTLYHSLNLMVLDWILWEMCLEKNNKHRKRKPFCHYDPHQNKDFLITPIGSNGKEKGLKLKLVIFATSVCSRYDQSLNCPVIHVLARLFNMRHATCVI